MMPTKAFEHSYSRALNVELKPMGITVTAVSPGWVDTDMLTREVNGRKVRFPGMVSPGLVDVKLMPHRLVMKIWVRGIKKYM